MADRLDRLEAARRRLGMRQVELATALGATQGHYSKVARRRTPPGPVLVLSIDRWLASNDPTEGPGGEDDLTTRIASLAEAIRDRCDELLALVDPNRRDDLVESDDRRARR